IRDKNLELLQEQVHIRGIDQSVELLNGAVDFLPVVRSGLTDEDPRMSGPLHHLFLQGQLLIQFLPRASAGELNGNLFRREAGKADEVPSQIDNLDRLAHIEDE